MTYTLIATLLARTECQFCGAELEPGTAHFCRPTEMQRIADYLNRAGVGLIATAGDREVTVLVPCQMNGKPAVYAETIRTMTAAIRLVIDIE